MCSLHHEACIASPAPGGRASTGYRTKRPRDHVQTPCVSEASPGNKSDTNQVDVSSTWSLQAIAKPRQPLGILLTWRSRGCAPLGLSCTTGCGGLQLAQGGVGPRFPVVGSRFQRAPCGLRFLEPPALAAPRGVRGLFKGPLGHGVDDPDLGRTAVVAGLADAWGRQTLLPPTLGPWSRFDGGGPAVGRSGWGVAASGTRDCAAYSA